MKTILILIFLIISGWPAWASQTSTPEQYNNIGKAYRTQQNLIGKTADEIATMFGQPEYDDVSQSRFGTLEIANYNHGMGTNIEIYLSNGVVTTVHYNSGE